MLNSTSKYLLLVLVLFCSCGWLMKPAEVELVGLAFPGENVVDITVLMHNRNPFSARASDMEYRVSIGGDVIGRTTPLKSCPPAAGIHWLPTFL